MTQRRIPADVLAEIESTYGELFPGPYPGPVPALRALVTLARHQRAADKQPIRRRRKP